MDMCFHVDNPVLLYLIFLIEILLYLEKLRRWYLGRWYFCGMPSHYILHIYIKWEQNAFSFLFFFVCLFLTSLLEYNCSFLFTYVYILYSHQDPKSKNFVLAFHGGSHGEILEPVK